MDCILFPCITIKCITYFSKVIKETTELESREGLVYSENDSKGFIDREDLVFPENDSKGVIDIDDS